ncbi:hypothetical protein CEXT_720351 [Caerostris extrusa]|uniref:Uncharacterized protein n=1 Tax=Caerostris extrusa TaxID=172846 RepID=A0AAV4SHD3_CAEEX|nr:hypothetical protein CEXT_720351 [Caerostris extrusa]
MPGPGREEPLMVLVCDRRFILPMATEAWKVNTGMMLPELCAHAVIMGASILSAATQVVDFRTGVTEYRFGKMPGREELLMVFGGVTEYRFGKIPGREEPLMVFGGVTEYHLERCPRPRQRILNGFWHVIHDLFFPMVTEA